MLAQGCAGREQGNIVSLSKMKQNRVPRLQNNNDNVMVIITMLYIHMNIHMSFMLVRFSAGFSPYLQLPRSEPASLPTCNKMHANITSLLATYKADMTASAKTKQQRSLKKEPSMRQRCICRENKVREKISVVASVIRGAVHLRLRKSLMKISQHRL